jgi:hypothetical protein
MIGGERVQALQTIEQFALAMLGSVAPATRRFLVGPAGG